MVVVAEIAAPRIAFAQESSAPPATPAGVQFDYKRGSGTDHCPDETSLRKAVSERLGYDAFQRDAQRRLSVELTRKGRILSARIEMRDARGELQGARDLTSNDNDCVELSSAAALAISVAIDPTSFGRTSPSPAKPEPAPQIPKPMDAKPPDARSDAAKSTSPLPKSSDAKTTDHAPRRVRISIGSLGSYGTAPALALGFTSQVAFQLSSRFSTGVEGRADIPAGRDAAGGGTASTSLLATSLVPCAHLKLLHGCVLASLGRLHASASGVDAPQTGTSLFASLGGRLGVEVPALGPLLFRLHADLQVPMVRAVLNLNHRDIWTAPPITAALGAAAVVRFF